MQQFTSLEDIEPSKQPLALGVLIEHLLSVELSIAKTTTLNSDDGAIYLLEDGDNDQTLINQFGRPFTGILFEGIQHIAEIDSYVCRFLRDNQCCITLIVTDKAWLPGLCPYSAVNSVGHRGLRFVGLVLRHIKPLTRRTHDGRLRD